MKAFARLPLLWALLPMLCGLGLPALARAAPKPKQDTLTLSFDHAEIEGVARTLSDITHHNIVVDPRVKGTLTLNTDTPVTPAQAWDQFLAALRLQGFIVVEGSGLYKIMPEADGKLQSGPVGFAAGPVRGDQIVTEIFKLNYENASNLLPVLRPLISPNNVINVNAGNNSVVITDYANNLVRLRTIIAAMDTPSATDVEVIPLHYTTATDIAVQVRRLAAGSAGAADSASASGTGTPGAAATPTAGGAGGAGSAGAAASILADTATNSLLVRAPNRAQLASIRALVAQLDQVRNNVNVRVVYLKNAEATRIAQVLRAAFPADATGSTASGTSASPAAGASSSAGGSPSSASAASSASTGSSVTGTGSKAAGSGGGSVSAAAQPSTGGGIQADPATNSLIITASEPRFREMRPIIEQLDTRRAQLYVESLVVEVDASRGVDLGLQWAQLPDISSTTSLTLGTVAQALETITGTNILSTANVVTLDNEEAKVVVGQNVPYITGSYTTSTNSNPFQTVERKDVGITLRIRPQIGENGNIRMTIYQESSSVASTSATLGPTTNQRSVESTVTVDDGKIIVLGGLIEDSYTDTANNVPWISEIPYLGAVFRSISRTHKKTNLLVFLRPVVMKDGGASNALAIERYDYMSNLQKAMPAHISELPKSFNAPPVLVPMGN